MEAPAPASGGAAAFCASFKEYGDSTKAGTPKAQADAMVKASAGIRKNAPAEIKQSASDLADLMDAIGKAMQGGTPDPDMLKKAQTNMQKNLTDVITWVATNCKQ